MRLVERILKAGGMGAGAEGYIQEKPGGCRSQDASERGDECGATEMEARD